MYTPNHFKPKSVESVLPFIKKYNFGLLVSQQENRPYGTHLPFLIKENPEKELLLLTHLARANEQWQQIESQEVMVVFSQPHTYISSSWYERTNVPTWNYLAVHVYGKTNIIEGKELEDALRQLVDKYESDRPDRFSLEDLTEAQLKGQMSAIVGLEIKVQEIQASFKLSQNRNTRDFQNIIKELLTTDDPLAHEVAKFMEDLKNNSI